MIRRIFLIGAAALSYRYLERPFQRLARRVLSGTKRVTAP